jgi:hypothetical protein
MAGTVKVTFIGDSSNLKKHLQEVSKQMSESETAIGRFTNRLDSTGKSMMGFGKNMSIGVTLPIALAAKTAFQAASDMEESMSKVTVVFGKQTNEITKWSETSATKMGISQQAALEAAGSYGNLFQAFGIGKKESAGMSKELVQLASDLASFNNTSTEDALLALRSGLSGETEPLKRYGIAIQDARLKSEAFSMGLLKGNVDKTAVAKGNLAIEKSQIKYNEAVKKYGPESLQARDASSKLDLANQALEKSLSGVTGMLTPGQKAQAAYGLIMKDSKLAQGDFSRTSDGAANSLKIMQAQLKNTAAEAGVSLIPIVTDATKTVGGWAKSFSKLDDGQKKAIVSAALMLAAIGPLTTAIGALARATSLAIKVTGGFFKAVGTVKHLIVYRKELFALWLRNTKATIATVRQTLATIAQGVASKIAAASTWALGAAVAFLSSPITIAIAAIVAFVAVMVVLYKKNDTFRKFIDKAWKAIAGFFVAAWEKIKVVVAAISDWIKKHWDIIKVVLLLLLGPIGLMILAWQKFKKQIMTVFRAVADSIKIAVQVIKTVLAVLVVVIYLVFLAIKAYVQKVLIPVWNVIWTVVKWVWDKVSAQIKFAWENVIKPIWELIWSYITNVLIPVWNVIWTVVKWVWDKVSEQISSTWEALKPIFQAIWDWITNNLVPVFKSIWDGIKTGWDAVSNTFNDVYNSVKSMWENMQKAAQGLPKWLKEILGIEDAKIQLTGGQKFNQAIQNAKPATGTGTGNPANINKFVDGAKALGGRVSAGMPYKVGEGGGPELFVPSTSGNIYNARQTRSMGSTYNVTMNVQKTEMTQADLMVALKRMESLKVA